MHQIPLQPQRHQGILSVVVALIVCLQPKGHTDQWWHLIRVGGITKQIEFFHVTQKHNSCHQYEGHDVRFVRIKHFQNVRVLGNSIGVVVVQSAMDEYLSTSVRLKFVHAKRTVKKRSN